MKEEKRNSILLGSSSFFNDAGSNAISAILPFYISALGGGGVAIGLISGLRDGISSFFNHFAGRLSQTEHQARQDWVHEYAETGKLPAAHESHGTHRRTGNPAQHCALSLCCSRSPNGPADVDLLDGMGMVGHKISACGSTSSTVCSA